MKLSPKSERGVAQPGLARPSGGREVAGSNPVAPTTSKNERRLNENLLYNNV